MRLDNLLATLVGGLTCGVYHVKQSDLGKILQVSCRAATVKAFRVVASKISVGSLPE